MIAAADAIPGPRTALLEGLEWNVRLSQAETPALLDEFRATFDTYWEDSQSAGRLLVSRR